MALTTRWLWIGVLSFIVSACATTAPQPDFTRTVEKDLAPYSSLSVTIEARDGIAVSAADLERIRGAVIEAIARKRPSWAQAGGNGPLSMNVQLTRYEPGDAFARLMLAGLGQIHIDGEVVLVESASGSELGRYTVSKTFAWGGVYGAATSIADVEPAFAESVAKGVAP
jgi:hypothetical protein